MNPNLNQDSSLEQHFEIAETTVDELVRIVNTISARGKKAKKASQTGSVRDFIIAVTELKTLVEDLGSVADDLGSLAEVDVSEMMESGSYKEELFSLCDKEDIRIIESDGKFLCYPTIISLSPSDASVIIEKKKQRGIRPSFLVAQLKSLSKRQFGLKPEIFIEMIATAYDLVVAEKQLPTGTVVKLVDLFRVLTILPAAKTYTKSEFVRDIYLLDQSGVDATKSGRILRLPASAMTRSSGTMETVAKGGQIKLYAGISFEVTQ